MHVCLITGWPGKSPNLILINFRNLHLGLQVCKDAYPASSLCHTAPPPNPAHSPPPEDSIMLSSAAPLWNLWCPSQAGLPAVPQVFLTFPALHIHAHYPLLLKSSPFHLHLTRIFRAFYDLAEMPFPFSRPNPIFKRLLDGTPSVNSHGCPDRFHVSGHVIALLNYPVDRISWALFYTCLCKEMGFPGSVGVKTLLASAGDTRGAGSIPESGRFPGVGNGNRPQYSCLKNSMDRGAWWATVCGVAKSWTRLSD